MSSKELGTLAPPSGSPYAYMLHKKEELEISMRNRLLATRETGGREAEDISTGSLRRKETANEMRHRRRAEHAQAVVDDLCSIVADLFIAESKLLNLSSYGVQPEPHSDQREQLTQTIRSFVTALPLRYALSADTPSEVLLHMRLMAAVRSGGVKSAVHIHNMADDGVSSSLQYNSRDRVVVQNGVRTVSCRRLVTISCRDASGLLEYISKLLATGGSRVLDADVMLNEEGIVLVRALGLAYVLHFLRLICRLKLENFTAGSFCG
jgi:hypothetical protein